MASTQALSAATQDRKSRLAQLKSLKRKAPDEPTDDSAQSDAPLLKSPRQSPSVLETTADSSTPEPSKSTSAYLSGRNYDPETAGPRLGFEHNPGANQETLEQKAAALATETKRQAAEAAEADKPIDLFTLQPKKPNWDLKRDLDRKMEILGVRTNNAIARLVRERVAEQKKRGGSGEAAAAKGDGEAVGMDGAALVEATNVREREDEDEARREREIEDELAYGR